MRGILASLTILVSFAVFAQPALPPLPGENDDVMIFNNSDEGFIQLSDPQKQVQEMSEKEVQAELDAILSGVPIADEIEDLPPPPPPSKAKGDKVGLLSNIKLPNFLNKKDDAKKEERAASEEKAETKDGVTAEAEKPKKNSDGSYILNSRRKQLFDAILKGDNVKANSTLKKGSVTNRRDRNGVTALMVALSSGNSFMAEKLIDNGASINIAAKNGITPLMLASMLGDIEIVKKIISKKAKINAKDSGGNTALRYAVLNHNTEAALALIREGADVKENTNGENILHLASYLGNVPVVKAAVQKGADVNSKNASGITPIGLAVSNRHKQVAAILWESSQTGFSGSMAGITPSFPSISPTLSAFPTSPKLPDLQNYTTSFNAPRPSLNTISPLAPSFPSASPNFNPRPMNVPSAPSVNIPSMQPQIFAPTSPNLNQIRSNNFVQPIQPSQNSRSFNNFPSVPLNNIPSSLVDSAPSSMPISSNFSSIINIPTMQQELPRPTMNIQANYEPRFDFKPEPISNFSPPQATRILPDSFPKVDTRNVGLTASQLAILDSLKIKPSSNVITPNNAAPMQQFTQPVTYQNPPQPVYPAAAPQEKVVIVERIIHAPPYQPQPQYQQQSQPFKPQLPQQPVIQKVKTISNPAPSKPAPVSTSPTESFLPTGNYVIANDNQSQKTDYQKARMLNTPVMSQPVIKQVTNPAPRIQNNPAPQTNQFAIGGSAPEASNNVFTSGTTNDGLTADQIKLLNSLGI